MTSSPIKTTVFVSAIIAAACMAVAAGFFTGKLLASPAKSTTTAQTTPSTTATKNTTAELAPANDGPYTHKVLTATSPDGVTWTRVGTVLEHASVPQSILLPNGTIRTFYVDASKPGEHEGMNCADLSSDVAASTVMNCTVTGLPQNKKMLDPAAVVLSDGRVRLYFYEGDLSGSVDSTTTHNVASAISPDGTTFTYEGIVFSYGGLVDPDVFFDGTLWHMYVYSITDRTTIEATSTDGTDFSYVGPLSLQSVGTTAPFQTPDGTWFMYGFNQTPSENTFTRYTSTDLKTWTVANADVLAAPSGTQITDPQTVQKADGSYVMTYKESAMKTTK